MYKRDAEKTIVKLSQSYPVVAVTGPRQSGKTTLTRFIFMIPGFFAGFFD